MSAQPVSSPDPVTEPAGAPGGMSGAPGPLMRLFKNQAVAFLLVGAFNTALGTAWFIVWQLAVGDTLGYHFAIVAGYASNVLCAFSTYRYLAFRVRGHFLRDLWRFVTVNLSAFLLNLALMTLAVSVFGFPPIPAQIVITAVTATASFFGYRDFSFRRAKHD
ncbi:GtrA family protein [Rhodococcus sp. 14C212]|uniref:GtrA family protein n=1 Tax=Rhodococcus sp. 14C212 TaxID=2711209 RepID=UPI0013EC21D2|nr:GtrA family protein [Rhodococcus sp. 14C212]